MADTEPEKHRCRGMTEQSHYKKRCPRKINPDEYKQGIRYCKPHIDQEVENDEASSTDGEGEEDTGEPATTPQTHPAPFIYIGNSNSKQYADNPQAAHRPQTHSTSTGEPKQREQVEPQTPFISRFGHGSRHSEQPSQYKQSSQPLYQSGSHTTKPFGQYKPTSEPPSQYKQSSQPLYQLGSHPTKPFGQYKPTSEPPSAHSSVRRNSSTSYGRNQQADFTYGSWKAANPSEFGQPQIPPTIFNATSPPSAYASNTRPTQREKRPQPSQNKASQAPALDRPPTGHFSINVPSYGAQMPGSPKKTVAVSTDRRSPTWGLDGGKGRQTRVSPAQIQQQYATVCEHWQHFSTGVEDLIGMLQPE